MTTAPAGAYASYDAMLDDDGETVTYTIVASNAGPSAVVAATVTDPLPATVWDEIGWANAETIADAPDSRALPAPWRSGRAGAPSIRVRAGRDRAFPGCPAYRS